MRVSKKIKTIAYHEAGHVIVAVALKVPFERVSIVPADGALGCVKYCRELSPFGEWTSQDTAYARKMVVVLMAGMAAEERYNGKYNTGNVFEDRFDADALSLRLATGDHNTYLTKAYKRAQRVLEKEWHKVDKIAQALLTQMELSSEAVNALLK
jgi:ATP-dependent Zn protease